MTDFSVFDDCDDDNEEVVCNVISCETFSIKLDGVIFVFDELEEPIRTDLEGFQPRTFKDFEFASLWSNRLYQLWPHSASEESEEDEAIDADLRSLWLEKLKKWAEGHAAKIR